MRVVTADRNIATPLLLRRRFGSGSVSLRRQPARRKGGTARIVVVLIGMLAVADVDAATLQVAYGGGRLSVIADGAALSEVLGAVARQAGFRIDGLDTLSEPVTISLAGVPLREALPRLLMTLNYVLIEDQTGRGPKSPTSVHVFGRKGRGGGTTSPGSAVEAQAGRRQPGAPPAPGGPAGTGEEDVGPYGMVAFSDDEEEDEKAPEENGAAR